MKICFISHASTLGGAEKSLLELLDAVRVQKDVNVCVFLPSSGPLACELSKRHVHFTIVPYRRWAGIGVPGWKRFLRTLFNVLLAFKLAIIIRRNGCDLVYTSTVTIFSGALAAKVACVPHVWHIQEFGDKDHGLRFDLGKRLSFRLIGWLSAACIANSNAVRAEFMKFIDPRKITTVYYSVEVAGYEEKAKDLRPRRSQIKPMRCLIVGEIKEGKRQEDAIKAIKELMDRGIEVELTIVGGGDPQYVACLRKLVQDWSLGNVVQFIGYLHDPFQVMAQHHVLLMCSRSEAFGRVTVEAMRAGMPVIGTRSGGTMELIKDSFNGLLYEPLNYKDLAYKIEFLVEHPDLREAMAVNAARWANQTFTSQRYAGDVMGVVKAVLRT